MFPINNNILRNAIIGGVVIALMLAAYAFASSNVVPTTNAGSGSNTISGYTVQTVDYQLLASDPTKIDYWELTLSATADDVRSRLATSGSGSTWITCTTTSTLPATGTWKCEPAAGSEFDVSNASSLQVVAVADNP